MMMLNGTQQFSVLTSVDGGSSTHLLRVRGVRKLWTLFFDSLLTKSFQWSILFDIMENMRTKNMSTVCEISSTQMLDELELGESYRVWIRIPFRDLAGNGRGRSWSTDWLPRLGAPDREFGLFPCSSLDWCTWSSCGSRILLSSQS